jgi:uncharacterized protein YdhG (YjbR/CyaY superfamily)
MAAKKTATKSTKKSTAKRTSAPRNASSGKFSAEERAAMKDRARELKASKDKEEGKRLLREAIAKMKEPDRATAKRVDAIVMAAAPELAQRTWYGMPAYAKDDKVLCFFQDAQKFKSRYATFGFSDEANLDKGGMWPTSFALMDLTPAEEKKIGDLVKKAVR